MKFIIICPMHGLSRKFLALILSLMLALVPLQGLLASDMHIGHEAAVSGMQVHMDHEQAPAVDTATDCGDCTGASSCCSGNSCNMHQCASCVVMAFLPESFYFQPPGSADISAEHPVGSVLTAHTLLYRPPQV
jgi:hypothetical protein